MNRELVVGMLGACLVGFAERVIKMKSSAAGKLKCTISECCCVFFRDAEYVRHLATFGDETYHDYSLFDSHISAFQSIPESRRHNLFYCPQPDCVFMARLEVRLQKHVEKIHPKLSKVEFDKWLLNPLMHCEPKCRTDWRLSNAKLKFEIENAMKTDIPQPALAGNDVSQIVNRTSSRGRTIKRSLHCVSFKTESVPTPAAKKPNMNVMAKAHDVHNHGPKVTSQTLDDIRDVCDAASDTILAKPPTPAAAEQKDQPCNLSQMPPPTPAAAEQKDQPCNLSKMPLAMSQSTQPGDKELWIQGQLNKYSGRASKKQIRALYETMYDQQHLKKNIDSNLAVTSNISIIPPVTLSNLIAPSPVTLSTLQGKEVSAKKASNTSGTFRPLTVLNNSAVPRGIHKTFGPLPKAKQDLHGHKEATESEMLGRQVRHFLLATLTSLTRRIPFESGIIHVNTNSHCLSFLDAQSETIIAGNGYADFLFTAKLRNVQFLSSCCPVHLNAFDDIVLIKVFKDTLSSANAERCAIFGAAAMTNTDPHCNLVQVYGYNTQNLPRELFERAYSSLKAADPARIHAPIVSQARTYQVMSWYPLSTNFSKYADELLKQVQRTDNEVDKWILSLENFLIKICFLTLQLFRGLHALHSRNFIHGDIKSDNFLVTSSIPSGFTATVSTRNSESKKLRIRRLVLIDPDLARPTTYQYGILQEAFDKTDREHTSKGYMAPELRGVRKTLTKENDIYRASFSILREVFRSRHDENENCTSSGDPSSPAVSSQILSANETFQPQDSLCDVLYLDPRSKNTMRAYEHLARTNPKYNNLIAFSLEMRDVLLKGSDDSPNKRPPAQTMMRYLEQSALKNYGAVLNQTAGNGRPPGRLDTSAASGAILSN